MPPPTALYRNPSAIGQSASIYHLPVDLLQISSSLKIDEPFTPMRIGQLSMSIENVDPLTGTNYWLGLTWAETFFPFSGERPSSVGGNKAYEVVLKQSIKDGGRIVRENVITTGRIIGVVSACILHDTGEARRASSVTNKELL